MRINRLSFRFFLNILLVLIIPFAVMLFAVRYSMEGILRDEISAKVVQNMQRSESDLNQLFSRMTNISNVFFWDDTLMQVFENPDTTYYQRYAAFNRTIRYISMQNLYEYRTDNTDIKDDHIRITFQDQRGQLYASWSRNYRAYEYLFKPQWVQDTMQAGGFMQWNMGALGYQPEGIDVQPDQVALARAIHSDSAGRSMIGTLLLSIDQQMLVDILSSYKYNPSDLVFSTYGDGELLSPDEAPVAEIHAVTDRFRGRETGNEIIDFAGRKYLLTFYTVDQVRLASKDGLKIFYLADYQHLDAQISQLTTRINLFCIFFVLAVAVLAGFIADRIARPMRTLSSHMAHYQVGDMPQLLEPGRRDEIGDIYSAYYDMSNYIQDLFTRLRQEQITKEKYYYESLRSKMSPHFLFNTLNSIRWMAVIRGADNIRESIDALAAILQYSLETGDEMVPLRREIAILERYCHVQNVRFGSACRVEVDLPDNLYALRILRFILQPAAENSFKHGFTPAQEDRVLTIRGQIREDRLFIYVADNGRGFSAESLEAFARRRDAAGNEPGEGNIGLRIIDERIRVAFGEVYGISLSNRADGGAQIDYHLPVLPPEDAPDEDAKEGHAT